ncbi:MAG TPA: lipase family protein [Coleofasciculaceae cyanobacterium]|jgi:hypothetical protein
MKLNRRHLLRATLAAGAATATQLSWVKPGGATSATDEPSQSAQVHQASPSDLAALSLKSLPDPELASLLLHCCTLTPAPSRTGSNTATNSPAHEIFDRHWQIASFQAQSSLYQPQFHGVAVRMADRAAIYGKRQNFGLALRSPQHNIIALQATQSDAEWLQYATAPLEAFDLLQPEQGQIHSWVKQLHAQLQPQIQAAVQQFDLELPCYVTGYSLGGALAHVAAAEIALNAPQLRDKIHIYSFGVPQFGDRTFAKFYDALLPYTYCFVNLADCIPALPSDLAYQPIGQAHTYLKQQGNMALNHAIETYQAAIGFS